MDRDDLSGKGGKGITNEIRATVIDWSWSESGGEGQKNTTNVSRFCLASGSSEENRLII